MTSLKLLIAPFSLAFLVLFGIFWVYPEYGVVQEKQKMVADKEAVLQKNLTMVANGGKLFGDFQASKGKEEALLKILPREGSEEDALWLFSQLAQNSGVTLTSISFEQSKEEVAQPESVVLEQTFKDALGGVETAAPTPELRVDRNALSMKYTLISFSSVGTYDALRNFLSSLKGLPRVVREDTVSVSVDRGDEKTGSTFQLSGSVGFAYAPMRRLDSGSISPAFESSTLDFASLEKKQQGFEVYPASQEIPYGRPNPFIP